MEHILLFESFLKRDDLGSRSRFIGNLVFDFWHFDTNIQKSNLPPSLNSEELIELAPSIAPGYFTKGKGPGTYLGCEESPTGEFVSIVLTEPSPLKFDFEVFDSEYERVCEIKNTDFDTLLSDISKLENRFKVASILKKTPDLWDILKRNNDADSASASADLGELGF